MMLRFRSALLALLLALLLVTSAWTETVMVPTRDGTKLATDYYVPATGGPTFPVIMSRTVYGRGGKGMQDLGRAFNERGIAFVSQDSRGRGNSEGTDPCFADDGWGERQDGVDSVRWIRSQPWSNGKIGTWGGSALGITQVLLAGAEPSISAQSIVVACSSLYGQLSYQGGVFRKALCEGWLTLQNSKHIIDLWHSHPTYDEFWKGLNSELRAQQVTAPGFHVGGWFDLFNQGTINNFVCRQYHGGEGARGNQKLVMGAWVHGIKQEIGDLKLRDNFNFKLSEYERRFMDYWLKGEQNGIMDEPAVHYYTLGDCTDPNAPGNEWRTAQDWPPLPINETPYYLTEAGSLTTEPLTADSKQVTFTYDPADPCPTHGGQNLLLPAGPFDQRKVSGHKDVLKFATPSLDQPLEITGAVRVELFVSSDAADTDFIAKLVDIYPDGREILMLDNIQRVKFRNGFEKAAPLPPGEVGKITIDLWSISLIFNTGHQVGLQVSSSNYPRFEKNPNTGEDLPREGNLEVAHNSVHLDKTHPSALILPVRVK
ncbi:MAG: CocE/NonD family hydrolase [Candidatus Hydrogenedentes bacterium]|nr:CocE/NonD family hydrolase [Candidatus Hydrogenedentota bacterium]